MKDTTHNGEGSREAPTLEGERRFTPQEIVTDMLAKYASDRAEQYERWAKHANEPLRSEYADLAAAFRAHPQSAPESSAAPREPDELNPEPKECSQCHHDLTWADGWCVVDRELWCYKCFQGPALATPSRGTAGEREELERRHEEAHKALDDLGVPRSGGPGKVRRYTLAGRIRRLQFLPASAPREPSAPQPETRARTRRCDFRRPECVNDGVTVGGVWVCRNHLNHPSPQPETRAIPPQWLIDTAIRVHRVESIEVVMSRLHDAVADLLAAPQRGETPEAPHA